MAPSDLDFAQVVFSGGGTRCFWFGGFLKVVGPAIHLRPRRICGVSGGALSAAAFVARREDKLIRVMGEAFERLDDNVQPHKIAENEGVTPHQKVYRQVVSETFDRAATQAVAEGPDFEVLLAHPPSRRFPKLSTFPVMALYELELALRSNPHMRWTDALGVRRSLVDARQAARDGRLVDLICNAAVIPPVFNIQRWGDELCIDGGMTDKAPLPSEDEGRTLVLLTRHFRNPPQSPRRLYVMPSRETPADKIDFTSREKIERTWTLGERDGRAFLESHGATVEETTH
jgi:predicted acylesterase/phospholipase RssA